MSLFDNLLYLLPLILLIMASAFFSGSETALFSLGHATLKRWRLNGNRSQQLVARLMDDHHGTLIAILLGTNFVNILTAIIFNRWMAEYGLSGPKGPVIAATLITIILLIFGEVSPKTIAYNLAPTLAQKIAVPIHLMYRTCQKLGLIWLLRSITSQLLARLSREEGPPALSAEEYETFIHLGKDLGVFQHDEARLLELALRLREIAASQVMTPRVDVTTIDISMREEEIMEKIREYRHRLLPVIDEDFDHVVGLLEVKAFVMGSAAVRSDWRSACVRPALYVPELSPLTKVLEQMRNDHQRLGFVVDEYGGVEGILTLEDIFEEIIGEIEDEYDTPSWQITELGVGHWRLSGMIGLHALDDIVTCELPEVSADTVAGLLAEELGDLPKPGDVWRCEHYEFLVRHVHRQRLLTVDLFDTRRRGDA